MPIPFTLRQLEYFVAVAERGSVTAAAAARNVSQPSISVAISELEAILGRKLFMRQAGHRLTITPAGRRLLVQARTTLAAAARIAGVDEAAAGHGELSITCFRDLGSIYLPGLLMRLGREHKALSCRLAEGDLPEVLAQVLDGRYELALTYDIDLRRHGLSRLVLDRLAPHVMLAPDHPLARETEIDITSLAAERIIIEDFPVTLEYFIEIFRRNGRELQSIQRAPSFEMQRGLVANGWGVGLSCVQPVPDLSYDGAPLVCLPLAGREPTQDVVIAHLGLDTLSLPARRFIEMAASQAEKQDAS